MSRSPSASRRRGQVWSQLQNRRRCRRDARGNRGDLRESGWHSHPVTGSNVVRAAADARQEAGVEVLQVG